MRFSQCCGAKNPLNAKWSYQYNYVSNVDPFGGKTSQPVG